MKLHLRWISIVLVLTFISPASFGAVNAGGKCSKVGQTKIANDKKFTCVKKGGRLIWSKGNKTFSVDPVSKTSYPAGPTSFEDLIEHSEGISYAAWSKAKAAIQSSTARATSYKVLTGPNTTLANPNPSRAFDLTSKLYSNFKAPSNLSILSFSFNDRDWAESQMINTAPYSEWRWLKYTACATRDTCWGGGMFMGNSGEGILVLATEIVDENHTSGTVEAHEYTHAIQQNQMGRTQPWPPTGNWPPTWYLEGQAEFSQNAAIYFESFAFYTSARRFVSDGLFKDSQVDSKWIQDYFVVNPPSSWHSKYDRWRQYDLGGMLIEVLTAIKGPSSTMEVWKLCGEGMSFEQAFEQIYGKSFASVLPIISKAIALQLGRS